MNNEDLALGVAIGSSSCLVLIALVYVIHKGVESRAAMQQEEPDLSVFDEAITPRKIAPRSIFKRSPSSAVKRAVFSLSNLASSFKTPPRRDSRPPLHGHGKRPSGRSFWSIDISNPADADSVDPKLDPHDLGSPSSFATGIGSASIAEKHSKTSSLSSSSISSKEAAPLESFKTLHHEKNHSKTSVSSLSSSSTISSEEEASPPEF